MCSTGAPAAISAKDSASAGLTNRGHITREVEDQLS
jgi:hypothetical protein